MLWPWIGKAALQEHLALQLMISLPLGLGGPAGTHQPSLDLESWETIRKEVLPSLAHTLASSKTEGMSNMNKRLTKLQNKFGQVMSNISILHKCSVLCSVFPHSRKAACSRAEDPPCLKSRSEQPRPNCYHNEIPQSTRQPSWSDFSHRHSEQYLIKQISNANTERSTSREWFAKLPGTGIYFKIHMRRFAFTWGFHFLPHPGHACARHI